MAPLAEAILAPIAPRPATDQAFVDSLGPQLARLARIARLLCGDAASADELLAEAISRSLAPWRRGGVTDTGAYVRRVMINLLARRSRRLALSRRRDHRALDWLPAATDHTDQHADRELVLRALRTLPPRRRAVVVLRFYDDLTEATIADTLGISVGTVKSQLSRALEQLRTELATQDQS